MSKAKITFEDALAGLERSASELIKPDITLDDAMSTFEKGIEYYNKCGEILDSARQRITTYSSGEAV